MIHSEVELPFQAPILSGVRVAALAETGTPAFADRGDVQYLRQARMNNLGDSVSRVLTKSALRRSYERRLKDHALNLSQAFGSDPFDLVISPPSRFEHALPYRCAFLRSGRIGADLTEALDRAPGVYAGSGATLEQVVAGLKIRNSPPLKHCRSLLIVDDILWRGVTAVAWVLKLREAGLPKNARLHFASPLWIRFKP